MAVIMVLFCLVVIAGLVAISRTHLWINWKEEYAQPGVNNEGGHPPETSRSLRSKDP